VSLLRNLITEWLVGMDARMQKRWLRLWKDLERAEPGEGFQLYRAEARSGPYHRMHRAMLTRLFEQQDEYDDEDAVHDWFKFKCYFVEWTEGPITGRPIPTPRSTNFDDCSEDEIREFHNRMVDKLHEPDTQAHFWPMKTLPERAETVEFILKDPDEPAHHQPVPSQRQRARPRARQRERA
jgi:hypothetical protein